MHRAVVIALCAAVAVANEHIYNGINQASVHSSQSTYRRYSPNNACVEIEGGALYCFQSADACSATHYGECPPAGTKALAKCTPDVPGYHTEGAYEGLCVLKTDTICVLRDSGFTCSYTANPQAGPAATEAPETSAPETTASANVQVVDTSSSVNSVSVKSDAAGVAETEHPATNSNVTGIAIGIGGVAAVAIVGFLVYRNRNTGTPVRRVKKDHLVTPDGADSEKTAEPNLLGSGPLTPTLVTEKQKIFSV
ncbi:unnamed protein product [Aphanomyces euteiches]|uniref:Uncharacterized protein n=1 Tax=Aphanomyces euteiches TaxID=100861 RepID=A0A6G0X7G4_9STRA|nr:hypothetical protein Ae201684_007790 [Aphanomyces euteiches]KAH9067326.1 hypothetical protein Ae201684P_021486 [Aphanomyces euteiches]KAH9145914.1 hypothetical protein AeRB84_010216 [Aphanomyces euteiches]